MIINYHDSKLKRIHLTPPDVLHEERKSLFFKRLDRKASEHRPKLRMLGARQRLGRAFLLRRNRDAGTLSTMSRSVNCFAGVDRLRLRSKVSWTVSGARSRNRWCIDFSLIVPKARAPHQARTQ